MRWKWLTQSVMREFERKLNQLRSNSDKCALWNVTKVRGMSLSQRLTEYLSVNPSHRESDPNEPIQLRAIVEASPGIDTVFSGLFELFMSDDNDGIMRKKKHKNREKDRKNDGEKKERGNWKWKVIKKWRKGRERVRERVLINDESWRSDVVNQRATVKESQQQKRYDDGDGDASFKLRKLRLVFSKRLSRYAHQQTCGIERRKQPFCICNNYLNGERLDHDPYE